MHQSASPAASPAADQLHNQHNDFDLHEYHNLDQHLDLDHHKHHDLDEYQHDNVHHHQHHHNNNDNDNDDNNDNALSVRVHHMPLVVERNTMGSLMERVCSVV